MLMNSYFSVNQANEILPTVIKKFEYAKKMKVEVMKMEQQLTSGLTPTTSLEEYTTIKKKLNSLVTKFYQAIEDLESTGVLLKGSMKAYLTFLQSVLMKKFGFVGKKGKLRLNFGMKKIQVLLEENQLV